MIKLYKMLAAVSFIILMSISTSFASSVSLERWQTERESAIGSGVDGSYSAHANAISVAHTFERTNTSSIGIKGRYFQEGSAEVVNGESFDVTGIAIEGSRQFSDPSGLLLEAIVGFSYRKYEVPTLEEIKYSGVSLGGAFAYPIISNKLFIGGSANYQLLKDTENNQSREGHQLSGIRADLGLIYAYYNYSIRIGYRIRNFKTSEITDLAVNDKASGAFLAVSMSF